MITKRKYTKKDYDLILKFLREQYLEYQNEDCWLAQRWEDMEFRVNELHTKEREGGISWHEYIMLWEDGDKLVGICNNEGGRECFMHIAKGYESLYPEMLTWAEEKISTNKFRWKGKKDLSVFALESQKYREKELLKRGYQKAEEFSYFKKFKCNKKQIINLPEGFELIVGTEGLNHSEIFQACEMGFHPEKELEGFDKNKPVCPSFAKREKAPMFDYKYEVVVKAPNGEIASYTYCWVDKITSTGYIEPVSTREKFRGLGLGKTMQIAVLNLLCDEKIDTCFVNPYGNGRDKFYSSAGYQTFDKEFEWKKELN